MLTRRYLRILFTSPPVYLIAAALSGVTAFLGVSQLVVRGQALTQPLVPIAGLLLIVLVPVVAVRPLTEDSRTSALDLFVAGGVPVRRIVLAAWTASVVACAFALLGLAAWWPVLAAFSEPSGSVAATGLFGLLLLAACVSAIAVGLSAFSSNFGVPVSVSVLVGLALWFVHSGPSPIAGIQFLEAVSLSERLRGFANGQLDSNDVFALAVITTTSLFVAVVALHGRRHVEGRRSHRRAMIGAASVVAVVAVLLATIGVGPVIDLTQERSGTLSKSTMKVLDNLEGDIQIVAGFGLETPGRSETATLLDRYSRYSRAVSWRFADPSTDGRAVESGLQSGGALVDDGENIQVAEFANELEITSAIARLGRVQTVRWCTPLQAGGRTHPDADYGRFSELVERAGYARVSEDCDLMVIAQPQGDLPEIKPGQDLLLALEPESDASELLNRYGIRQVPGLILETDPGRIVNGDLVTQIVTDFVQIPPTTGQGPVVLVGPTGLEVEPPRDPGISNGYLATTSDGAVDAQGDEGRFGLIATADDSVVVDGKVIRTRIFVIADADAFSDAFIDTVANASLAVRAMDWLSEQELITDAASSFPKVRPLLLTTARRNTMLWVLGLVVPAAYLLAGLFVWVLRRGE